MRFEIPFTHEDLARGANVPITPEMLAKATFEGVRAAFNYWVFHLRAVLQGCLNPTQRERAVMTLLYRAIGYLASIRKLNSAMHVQTVSSSTRSLFEIGVDLELLHHDGTDDSVQRLEAFTKVERYRVAQKSVDYFADHPLPDDYTIDVQRALVTNPTQQAEIERLIILYWGRNRAGKLNWPKHWSRFADTRARARTVGGVWEQRYVRHYYTLSWQIHAGLTGVADLPRRTFDGFSALAHKLATEVILDCFEILGSELHLADAIPDWAVQMNFLQHAMSTALADERLCSLGEPSRFRYLEPHEQEIGG
jgi:Family of unknown function (DUF5677)